MSPAQPFRLHSRLGFLQTCDDLLFTKSLRLHCPLRLGGLYSSQGLRAAFKSSAAQCVETKQSQDLRQRVPLDAHYSQTQLSAS